MKANAGGTFSHLLPDVVERLPLGDRNKRLSRAKELRYGSKGSLSVDLTKGTYYDHEAGEGGGVLDLIKRYGHADPIAWLQDQGLIEDSNRHAFQIEHVFVYEDESSKPLFEVCRLAEGGFRQRKAGSKKWGIEGVRRVLYRLPQLIAEKDTTVFIPEGEKHVDALRALGLTATCNPMGAGKWRNEYAEFLRGRDVVILPDNDKPGQDHAATIAASLVGAASRVRMLKLPGLPAKGDIIDWLHAGGTKEQLLALAEQTPTSGTHLDNFLKSASDLRTKHHEPLKYIVPRYVVEGLSLLIGKPKVRKSWLVLEMAVCVAEGSLCLGECCEAGDVLYLALEDSDRRLKGRLEIMLGSASKWPARLTYATDWPTLDQRGLELIEEWIKRQAHPRLVIIDVLQRVRPHVKGRDAVYSSDYDTLKQLQKLAGECRIGIIVVHHQRKASADDIFDTASGTLGLTGAADATLILERSDQRRKLTGNGRDLMEFSVIIDQDDHMRWELLGDAAEVLLSDERRSIIDVLRAAKNGMRIGEIAAALGKPTNTIRQRIFMMHSAGEVTRRERGVYTVPPAPKQEDLPI